jgi:hypothetical protein
VVHPKNRSRHGSVDSDLAADAFEEHAQGAKKNGPVSRSLSGVDIYLRANFL